MKKSFGDRLIYYMHYKEIHAWKLAELTGIPFEEIEHYMLNDKRPDKETQDKLAKALGVDAI